MSEISDMVRESFPVVEDVTVERMVIEDDRIRVAPGLCLADFSDAEIDGQIGRAIARSYCKSMYKS